MSKVLIVQTAYLGDVVLTTPMIRAAREALDASWVSFIATPGGGAQVLGHPDALIEGLDEVIVYDKRGADKGLAGFIRMVKLIRSRSFDIILTPHRSARSSVLTWAGKASKTAGFRQAALAFLYDVRIPRYNDIHEVDRNLELVWALEKNSKSQVSGFEKNTSKHNQYKPVVAINDKARNAVDSMLKVAGIQNRKLIGIFPGTVWATKQWMPQGYAEVADALVQMTGASIVLMGAKSDLDAANQIEQNAKTALLNLVGKTSVLEMIALMERLSLMIGNDSGPTHITGALDIPVVAIFGPTAPRPCFHPLSTKNKIVEIDGLPCRPCSPHGPKICPEKHFKCMKDITPDMVIKAAQELL